MPPEDTLGEGGCDWTYSDVIAKAPVNTALGWVSLVYLREIAC